jgi:hypothetical protein
MERREQKRDYKENGGIAAVFFYKAELHDQFHPVPSISSSRRAAPYYVPYNRRELSRR